jgi:hypothetical protein
MKPSNPENHADKTKDKRVINKSGSSYLTEKEVG